MIDLSKKAGKKLSGRRKRQSFGRRSIKRANGNAARIKNASA